MLYISSTFTRDKTPFSSTLNLCKQNKIYNIEIGSNHCFEPNLDYIKNENNFNFIVHNYFPVPKEDFVVNIASLNDNIRQKSLNHIFKSLEFCKNTNSKLYTFHPGFLTDPKGAKLFSNNYDFEWQSESLQNADYQKSFATMISSLESIVKCAKEKEVRICFETEGSLNQNGHLLMQKPEEYTRLFSLFSSSDLGVNCNIGHLNLASNAFGFDKSEFVDCIKDYIVAFELSHNEGIEDEHKPLVDNEWYWDIILSPKYKEIIKILEFRNQSINKIKESIDFFYKKKNEKRNIR